MQSIEEQSSENLFPMREVSIIITCKKEEREKSNISHMLISNDNKYICCIYLYERQYQEKYQAILRSLREDRIIRIFEDLDEPHDFFFLKILDTQCYKEDQATSFTTSRKIKFLNLRMKMVIVIHYHQSQSNSIQANIYLLQRIAFISLQVLNKKQFRVHFLQYLIHIIGNFLKKSLTFLVFTRSKTQKLLPQKYLLLGVKNQNAQRPYIQNTETLKIFTTSHKLIRKINLLAHPFRYNIRFVAIKQKDKRTALVFVCSTFKSKTDSLGFCILSPEIKIQLYTLDERYTYYYGENAILCTEGIRNENWKIIHY